ncbi:MAG: histidine kinase [Janibacter sp.]|nr:histidine kinase [Janibacter sp.]
MPDNPRPARQRMGRALRQSGRGARWLTRGTRAHPDVAATLLAVLMFIIGWSTISQSHAVTASVMPLLAAMSVAPLLIMRRAPFVAWVVSAVGALVWIPLPRLADAPMPWPVVHFLILLAAILVAAMYAQLRLVAAVLAGSVLLFLAAMPDGMKPWALGAAIIVAFGLLTRWLVLSRRALAVQEEETEVERARRAVVEERSRIARELHDVVAHHMSMVVVQAQTAPYRVADLTPEAKGEFVAIEESARAALQEVRGVLGVLREEGAPVQTAPQPTLADLPALLESSRSAGMDLSWHLGLPHEDCPPGTGLVLHRVLQESLANASRHAPGASVRVDLVRVHPADAPAGALLTVATSPSSSAGSRERGGGNGIPGMRTRVEAVGGTLTAGPTAEGGFAVTASVPLTDRPRLGE